MAKKTEKDITAKTKEVVKEVAEEIKDLAEKGAKKVEENVKELIDDTRKLRVDEAGEKIGRAADKAVRAVGRKVAEHAKELAEASPINVLVVEKEIDSEEESEKKKKLEALKKKLKEKAKALEKKIEEVKKVDIKEEVRGEKEEKKETLVPIEDYLKASIHLGTRVITPDMRKYVYRRRADGLAVFNTALLDDKLREAIEYFSKFNPEDVIVICKREAGWKAVNRFSGLLGMRAFTKKYPAGILTNTNLENFTETKLIFICDPWLDKNAFNDAKRVNIQIMAICDTNNFTRGVDFVVPGNNKSWKSLGIILYLIARGYIEKRKLSVEMPSVQEFIEGWDELQPPT